MLHTVRMPVCQICWDTPIDVWGRELITNAWQKNGSNHYEYHCPDCNTTQAFEIPCEDAMEKVTTGMVLLAWLKAAWKGKVNDGD